MPDPENYGVAELDGASVVTRLVEKPKEPATDLALVGVYMFTPRDPRRGAGDRAVARAASSRSPTRSSTSSTQGRRVEPHIVRGWWKDTGRLDDMLEANRLILDTIEPRIDGELDATRRSTGA